jgi:hypothetical protein
MPASFVAMKLCMNVGSWPISAEQPAVMFWNAAEMASFEHRGAAHMPWVQEVIGAITSPVVLVVSWMNAEIAPPTLRH